MAYRTLRTSLRSPDTRSDIVVEGANGGWSDLYLSALTASWPVFLAALAGVFLAANFVFAALYALQPGSVANARPGFSDLFFFSVETLSTTGYGDMHPQSFWGHAVATLEIFINLIGSAGTTGIVFARFSRPRARLVFAQHPVVAPHDGVPTLMVRVANARNSFLVEATAKLWWLGPSVSPEGRRMVGFRPMTLLRAETPALALSWTLFHPIDAASPLFGKSEDDLLLSDAELVVSITGVDESSSQMLHSRHAYAVARLRWGHDFADMFRNDLEGRRYVDFSKIHETRPAL